MQKALFFMLAMMMSYSAYAEEVITTHNGMTLRADLELADGKALKDGVIIMLHGTIAHNRMEIMQAFSDLLNERGYSTLRPILALGIDARPSTMLDCAIDHKHKHEDAMDELAAWSDWLTSQGAGKIAALGHSRGGNQMLRMAKDDDSIEQIVLIAPMTWNKDKEFKTYKERYKQPLEPIFNQAQSMVKKGEGDELMELPGFIYCENTKATAAAVVSYYKDDENKDSVKVLAQTDKPVLLLVATEDTAVPDLLARSENITQDNVTVEVIDGADHFFRDLHAEDSADLIDEFLDWNS